MSEGHAEISNMEQVEQGTPNGHEPHHHAIPRLYVGIGAVLAVALAGIIWATWGDEIKDACFGEDGACPVTIEGLPTNASGAPALPPIDTTGY